MQFLKSKAKQAPRKGIAGLQAGFNAVAGLCFTGFIILYMFGTLSEDDGSPTAVQNFTDAIVEMFLDTPPIIKLVLIVILLGGAYYLFQRYQAASNGGRVE